MRLNRLWPISALLKKASLLALMPILSMSMALGLIIPPSFANDNSNLFTQFQPVSVIAGQFKQRKFFRVLKHPIVSSGELYFDQQLGFLWQTQQPITSAILFKNDTLYAQSGQGELTKINAGSALAKVMSKAISGDLAALNSEFTISQAMSAACLSLVPRNQQQLKVIASIELCGNGQLESLSLFEASGNRTEITLSLNVIEQLPERVRAQLQ